jgi:hypothetical protein
MDRVNEVDAILKRVSENGEKDGDGHWLELTHAKELGIRHERVWIHTTRREKFVRYAKADWTIGYNRRGRLLGDEGHPRMVHTNIGGVQILRHRAMALAAGIMTLEQYRDTKNFVIDHVEPRQPDAIPDDRPENLRVVSQSTNRTNPKNRKPRPRADGKSVTLTRKSTKETTPFASVLAAATFLGVHPGNLGKYMNDSTNRLSMPEGKGTEWEAAWTEVDGFACDDAVRIPGVPEGDERRISPTKGLLRALGDGKYSLAANVPNEQGYLTTWIDGRGVRVHRLVFKTFKRAEFDAELSKMPPGTDEIELHVDHIDGDKLNNALENLRAVDRITHNGKHSSAILWIDEGGEALGTYTTASEAARAVRGTNGQPLFAACILKVCKKVQSHTGWRRFAYADSEHAGELSAARVGKKRKIDAVYDTS